MEYNETILGQPLKREDIDWSQSRIIFIAPEFTRQSDVEVRPTKMYIAFRRKRGFAGVVILRSKLKVYIRFGFNKSCK